MSLLLNEDQLMLRESAAGFVAQSSPVSRLRTLRDADDQAGYSPDTWAGIGEMGFAGVLVPDAFGGLELDQSAAGVILDQLGRNLVLSPFLPTCVGAALVLREADQALAPAWLGRIATADAVVAVTLAVPGPGRLTAEPVPDGWRLTGSLRAVPFAQSADLLLLAANEAASGTTSFFAVDPGSAGLSRESVRLADGSLAAHLDLQGVTVAAAARIHGERLADKALDACAIAAAAELCGLASAAFDLTLAYLKERKQFGVAIGSFQALQHRAAQLYAEIELARAAVRKAQVLNDAGEDCAIAASTAKAMAGLAADLAVREGVQMHGGIGMTDEHDIGLFMKRARVLNTLFGDPYFHADRCAKASGY